MKVLTVLGTRPEAIKLASVIKALKERPQHFQTVVCVTGQHRSMLQQILRAFSIRPDHDLRVMRRKQTLSALTASILNSLAGVFKQEGPDVVLVQGDTTSAMVASLVGFYHRTPVGHVEAGLRTGDRYNPFPEEMNRKLIGAMASLHFAPTETARQALLREGVQEGNIFVTGNTIVDALQDILSRASTRGPKLGLDLSHHRLILVTAHRRENLGEPLRNICLALKELARRNSQIDVVYPVHLNPSVRDTVYPLLAGEPRIHLTRPLPYPAFVELMAKSYFIMTDSGGIQEEAPILGKPVLVLRDKTERPEAVLGGLAKTIGTQFSDVLEEAERLLNDSEQYQRMSRECSPFGDGKAAQRIADIMLSASGPSHHNRP